MKEYTDLEHFVYFMYFTAIGQMIGGFFFGGPNGITFGGLVGLLVGWMCYYSI